MKHLYVALILTAALGQFACGSKIFNAKYDQESEGALPAQQPPGTPTGDRTYVIGGFDIINQDENIAVIGNFGGTFLKPVGGSGKSLTYWSVYPSTGTNGLVTLVSATVDSENSRKTASWNGKKERNDLGFRCTFGGRSGGQENGASFYPIVAVVLEGLDIIVEDSAPKTIGSLTPRETGQDAPEHSVSITYRPQSNEYKVNIKQAGQAEINVTGSAISAAAKTAPRVALECNQAGLGPSFAPTYMMDNVIMRERK